MKKIVLQLNSLPKRERKLSSDDLEDIFGGCTGDGVICMTHSQCCRGECYGNSDDGFLAQFIGKCMYF